MQTNSNAVGPFATKFARSAQVKQWKEVMANFGDLFKKKVANAGSTITSRKWDEETQQPGDWIGSDGRNITEDVRGRQDF